MFDQNIQHFTQNVDLERLVVNTKLHPYLVKAEILFPLDPSAQDKTTTPQHPIWETMHFLLYPER